MAKGTQWKPPADHIEIALYASWDIASCLEPAIELLHGQSGALPDDQAVMLALLLRVKSLNSVAMSALGDDAETVESLQKRFKGMETSRE